MTSTERVYRNAQTRFKDWCSDHASPDDDWHEVVARYLRDVGKKRGPSSAIVHLSAIGRMARDEGRVLDTRNPLIQDVTSRLRLQMRS